MLLMQPPNKWGVFKITAGHNADVVLNAHCLHLEPTINIDSTENFIPKAGDKNGSVFGWNNKSIGVNGTSGTDDFDRFILNRTSVTSPTLILQDIWKGNILRWLDYSGTSGNWRYFRKSRTRWYA